METISGYTHKILFFLSTRDSGLGTRNLCINLIAFVLISSPAWSGERDRIHASPRDKCPVCGMFVAKYPDFLASIEFKDGSYAVFDGVKDLCRYFLNPRKYHPHKTAEILAVRVTDYYGLRPIDAVQAWYVKGSDIFGPMGRELIPFGKKSDAVEFMKDHGGKSILQFRDVTSRILQELD